ncbi:hypothetical protein [Streptomyces sedi]|uniref:hypothetical protein n=1 Tax=Streptomyces sedi TaxID=555059 RepID=UPI001476B4E4
MGEAAFDPGAAVDDVSRRLFIVVEVAFTVEGCAAQDVERIRWTAPDSDGATAA